MLTPKQRKLLLLLNEKLDADGFPPSYEEMAKALGLESKSNIHRLIVSLEARGFIRRLPGRSRAIQVLKMPGGAQPCPDVLIALEDLVSILDSGRLPTSVILARARKALAEAKDGRKVGLEDWVKATH